MPALVIQGSSASYTESGSGPAAVLLHSSASMRWQWRPLMDALKGFRRVLAPDLWGYGESDAFPGVEPSLAKEIAIVDGLAERAGGPIDLVGHSFGGALAGTNVNSLQGDVSTATYGTVDRTISTLAATAP